MFLFGTPLEPERAGIIAIAHPQSLRGWGWELTLYKKRIKRLRADKGVISGDEVEIKW